MDHPFANIFFRGHSEERSIYEEEALAAGPVEHCIAALLRAGLFDSRVVVEDVQDDPVQGAEVLRRVADLSLVVVFAERGVQDPVAAVLDASVAAEACWKNSASSLLPLILSLFFPFPFFEKLGINDRKDFGEGPGGRDSVGDSDPFFKQFSSSSQKCSMDRSKKIRLPRKA